MPMSLTAAVWQGPSVSGDVGYNVATVVRIITHATGKHAHIVVFPELFLSGYGLDTDQLHQRALRPNSTEMEAIGRAAKKGCIAVAVGYPERGEDGEVFNSCAVWNCHGKLVQSYRKVNLWGSWEAATFARGDPTSLRAQDVAIRDGCTLKLGVLICFDLEFPEPSRCLALDGATVLVAPTALGMGAVESIPKSIVPTRAAENQTFVLYSNLEGPQEKETDPPFCGSSAIIGPTGREIARAPVVSDGGGVLLLGQLDIGGAEYATSVARNPYLQDVRDRLKDGFYAQYTRARY